ncbi:hypothetical protein ACIBFB_12595 [Nocardiopsis sp. NPDC050513]|uniref:hypothetical protein n=1 Tax=Nocardiopsis sp. NPDC050513 TaxID=3364338 RepID=UPI0037B8F268
MSAEDPRPYWLVPARDLDPSAGDYERVRPLTAAERSDLRRRLNGPGGARQALNASERDHLARVPAVRDAGRVRAVRRALRTAGRADEYAAGVAAALAFAAGDESEGPVSGERPGTQPPVGGDLGAEEALAQRLLRGQPLAADRPRARSRAFLVGVEHSLMWLQCRTDDPPVAPEESG